MTTEFNRADAEYFWDYLNHSLPVWQQTFKPNINDKKQKGIISSNFFKDKEAAINQIESDNGKGIPCFKINEGTGTTAKTTTCIKKWLTDIDVRKERKVDFVSTQADYEHCQKIAKDTTKFIKVTFGIEVDLVIASGNGVNLFASMNIPISFKNDKEWKASEIYAKICYMEKLLAANFNDEVCKVDCISKDINRRMKVPGCFNYKDTEQKGGRISRIIYKEGKWLDGY